MPQGFAPVAQRWHPSTMIAKGTIVLAGGAGFLGRALTTHFGALGYRIVVLSRRILPDSGGVRHVRWDGVTVGDCARELDGAACVVNLAGRSVNCRYTPQHRAEILNSRVDATRAIGEAIARCARPPALWLNASSATIYPDSRDRTMDESSPTDAPGFSEDVCRAWEQAFFGAPAPHTRQVALRISLVFGRGHDGVFDAFAKIVRRGLGGAQGDGGQFVSWMHVADFCRAVEWIVSHAGLAGPINLCAPSPLPNREFMRAFRAACGRRIGLPATRWMLEVGAIFLRTEAELLLKSRRVIPARLLANGFHFEHPVWPEAVTEIVTKK